MTSVIWSSESGRQELLQWYDHFAKKIAGSPESFHVSTRFGDSHVIMAGDKNNPPLICLHAMRTGAAMLLSELGPLLDHYRIITPDLPGQSVRGLDRKLSLSDQSFAHWLFDIMDHFELPSTNVFGVSWGGFVAHLAATDTPKRIDRLALLVPAGIANGSHLSGLTQMLIPMIRYRLFPNKPNLIRLLSPIMSTFDDDWTGYVACTLKHMKFDARIPPLASDGMLEKLTMPTLVIAAEDDISFPGDAINHRINKLVPHAETELLTGSKHCPPTTPEFRTWLSGRLIRFFDEG
ncbi:alpha/beta fold hydrolase [Rhodopirellula sp. MGV]|uniref:alpha/beta fold hydrolase n=1 Tax=Rhodopirellula sp. MGV TaxID=2023130 RepID=UPI000B964B77|nr:alpha/beta hydrolase [Rhodopirellula sp. MGV]OYP36118.1 hypothetical protein CGZ80_10290 [Rhodopirellula sp. MGV]PNY36523.1 alpha/beta hydrolase [Rhodopirellula baltica]